MNNLLKILFALEFVLILIIIFLALMGNMDTPTAYAVRQIDSPSIIDFKIYTKAVCENASSHTLCRDRLFVKCGDTEYYVDDNNLENFTGCNNIALNLSNSRANGSAMFKKGWEDPRK